MCQGALNSWVSLKSSLELEILFCVCSVVPHQFFFYFGGTNLQNDQAEDDGKGAGKLTIRGYDGKTWWKAENSVKSKRMKSFSNLFPVLVLGLFFFVMARVPYFRGLLFPKRGAGSFVENISNSVLWAEIRFLSGLRMSDITYFSVYFSNTCSPPIRPLSGFYQLDWRPKS